MIGTHSFIGKWDTTIAEGRPAITGTNYLIMPGAHSDIDTTNAKTAGRVYYEPIVIPKRITLANLFIEITTAAGAGNKGQLGLYSADKDWQPVKLMLPSVEIAIDANAVVSGAYAITVSPGRYLCAFNFQANATTRVYRSPHPIQAMARTMGTTPFTNLWRATVSYGSLPSTPAVWTDSNGQGNGTFHSMLLDVTTP